MSYIKDILPNSVDPVSDDHTIGNLNLLDVAVSLLLTIIMLYV